MTSSDLSIALFFPRLLVHSGGVERTLKIMENGPKAGLRFTVFVSEDVIRSPEVRRRLEELKAADLIALEADPLTADGSLKAGFDAIVLPSEFWMPAMKRARFAGIRAPIFIEFHQLPYIGTLDVLKTAGINDPGPLDLVRFPFLASRVLGGSALYFGLQTVACANSIRSLAKFPKAGLMAVTTVTERSLKQFGYDGPMFVPDVHVGMDAESVHRVLDQNDATEFDGVYVGRFHPHKGFLDLPRIVARLKRLWKADVRVAVCGTPQIQKHLETFERRVDALGVRENLIVKRFLPRDELYAVMRRSKMLIYPSYVDAFSITTLESLSLGVPVVAYGIDAVSMIWGSSPGVFTSRVGDPDALASLCARLALDSRLDQARRETERRIPELLRKHSWDRAAAFERAFYESAWEPAPNGVSPG